MTTFAQHPAGASDRRGAVGTRLRWLFGAHTWAAVVAVSGCAGIYETDDLTPIDPQDAAVAWAEVPLEPRAVEREDPAPVSDKAPVERPPAIATEPTAYLTGVVDLALSPERSCALLEDDRIACWGENELSRLTDRRRQSRPRPFIEAEVPGAVEIGVGFGFSCVRRDDHRVLCWGSNANGQLGLGHTVDEWTPTVSDFGDAQRLAVSSYTTCVHLRSGEVECAGSNASLQIQETYGRIHDPRLIAGFAAVDRISTSSSHSCGIKDRKLSCRGGLGWGEIGDGTTNQSTDLRGVPLADVETVAAGGAHTCAVTGAGALHCWGNNSHAQLGDGTRKHRSRPVRVKRAPRGVVQLALAGHKSCARTKSDRVYCWGSLPDFPNPTFNQRVQRVPARVKGLNRVERIVAGGAHVCALMKDTTVSCWGLNHAGQLGDGTTQASDVPRRVIAPEMPTREAGR